MTAHEDITTAAAALRSAAVKLGQAADLLFPDLEAAPAGPSPAEVTVPDPPAAHEVQPGGF